MHADTDLHVPSPSILVQAAHYTRPCLATTFALTLSGVLQAILKSGPPPPPGKAESVVSTSTDSPSPDSPTSNPKSKIELKLTSDGQLVFNARQRRTLRRALLRRRKHDGADVAEFDMDKDVTDEERRIIVDVVQVHIGRPLPETTDVDELVKVLLSLGTGDAEL